MSQNGTKWRTFGGVSNVINLLCEKRQELKARRHKGTKARRDWQLTTGNLRVPRVSCFPPARSAAVSVAAADLKSTDNARASFPGEHPLRYTREELQEHEREAERRRAEYSKRNPQK